MSVIGYLRQCKTCGVRMLVTTEAKDTTLCPSCFEDYIVEVIAREVEGDDDWPIGEVRA